jgi:hypothetical protein
MFGWYEGRLECIFCAKIIDGRNDVHVRLRGTRSWSTLNRHHLPFHVSVPLAACSLLISSPRLLLFLLKVRRLLLVCSLTFRTRAHSLPCVCLTRLVSVCGIFCCFNRQGDVAAFRPRAVALSKKLRHRGPDWSGCYQSHDTILCHERLAIVGVGESSIALYS